ncbi:MAG: hypothetical protein BGO41_14700 [Clostridiales bacterium 38-18]|nr:MAG: hypothetical protein BGO41_14700 [Clostridiales bacterium 38-18]
MKSIFKGLGVIVGGIIFTVIGSHMVYRNQYDIMLKIMSYIPFAIIYLAGAIVMAVSELGEELVFGKKS